MDSFQMPIAYVNGSNIKYDQYGERKNKHVLFIHGLGSSSIAWRDIPQALSEHFHTISVDLIGFGGSDKPQTADYTIRGFSKFINDFIRKEEIGIKCNEKITLVGHSLGGYIAADVAIQNKVNKDKDIQNKDIQLIEKLVLIDSSGMLTQPTQLLQQYHDVAMESEPEFGKVKKVFEQMYAHPFLLLDIVVHIFIRTIKEQGAKRAFKTAFDDSTTRRIEKERLNEIAEMPCLMIWGRKDSVIPPDYSNGFKEVFSDAAFEIIEDAGHAPFVEKTALVYEKLRTFLTR
ncbi:MAG: alpha/beta hydrolase [Thermoproteota archaeon]|nr:alpha/beta hydrolase [Thermoproteota archaeon]